MSNMNALILPALVLMGSAGDPAFADSQVVGFAPYSESPDAGVWFERDMRQTGTAATVDLTGAGGDLETNQPLPIGAARLSTEFDNGDAANVGLPGVLGNPGDEFPSLDLAYSFLKASNAGQNLNAAVALKIEIYNETCDDPASAGDCYGILVFEPYVNGYGNHPLVDQWTDVSITSTSGGFWWTGGFGVGNSAGGPPYNTLNEWLGLMSSDFDDASVLTVQMGVGSYNQGQIGYFDDVSLSHDFGDGLDVSYDFEPSLQPSDKDDCKQGGWEDFNDPVFSNQGDCVSWINTQRRQAASDWFSTQHHNKQ